MVLRQEMNARFEAMEKSNAARFEALQNQIKFLMWYLGAGGVLVILKLFFPHIFPHQKISLFYEIFLVYLHTNKIQVMYNVFQHNILQLAIRKSQFASNLFHLKPRKVRSFFHFFQTIHKIFSLHPLCLFLVILLSLNSSALICLISFICVLLHFKGMLITQMVMIRYDGYDKI